MNKKNVTHAEIKKNRYRYLILLMIFEYRYKLLHKQTTQIPLTALPWLDRCRMRLRDLGHQIYVRAKP